jgi:hypothetical protein
MTSSATAAALPGSRSGETKKHGARELRDRSAPCSLLVVASLHSPRTEGNMAAKKKKVTKKKKGGKKK